MKDEIYFIRWLFSLFIFLFIGCGNPINPITIEEKEYCEDNKEVTEIKNDKVCVKSIICWKNKMPKLYSYGCFCDNLCLCFISESYNCTSINSKKCNPKSQMFIFPKEACSIDNLLENLMEMKKETSNKITEPTDYISKNRLENKCYCWPILRINEIKTFMVCNGLFPKRKSRCNGKKIRNSINYGNFCRM